jgi:hypothetical protein
MKKKPFDQSQPKRGGPPMPTSPLVEVRNSDVPRAWRVCRGSHRERHAHFRYLGERVSHAAADKRYEDHDENGQPHVPVHRRPEHRHRRGRERQRRALHQSPLRRQLHVGHREPRVFIDALRDIAPAEELGYDYEIGRDKSDPPNVDEIYAVPLRLAEVPRIHCSKRAR